MPSIRKTQPSDDEVQEALNLLHEHPYGTVDGLDDLAMQRLEKACADILVTVEPLLLNTCRRAGADDNESRAVIVKHTNTYLMRGAARVPPVFHRVLRWLERACINSLISHGRAASRMVPLDEVLHADGHRATEQDPDDIPDDEKVIAGPRKRAAELWTEDEPDDASWLGADQLDGVTEDLRIQALNLLPPSDRALLLLMCSQLESDRLESEDPRVFDRKPYRLCASKAAELLGRSANSVSVQWSDIRKKVNRTIGTLCARKLLREGQSLSTIRATLEELRWSAAETDKLIAQLGVSPGKASGGAQ